MSWRSGGRAGALSRNASPSRPFPSSYPLLVKHFGVLGGVMGFAILSSLGEAGVFYVLLRPPSSAVRPAKLDTFGLTCASLFGVI